MAGLSPSRWTQIIQGYKQEAGGVRVPVRAPASTLARMARVVGATAEQLRAVGREDAAAELVVLLQKAKEFHQVREKVGEIYDSMMSQREREASGATSGSYGWDSSAHAHGESDAAEFDPIASDQTLIAQGWNTARELTDAVVESNPSDRLLAAARDAVHFIDGSLIIQILSSGHAPALEQWLAQIYRERELFHQRLSPPGGAPTPWVDDGLSPEEAAAYFVNPEQGDQDVVETATQSDASSEAQQDEEVTEDDEGDRSTNDAESGAPGAQPQAGQAQKTLSGRDTPLIPHSPEPGKRLGPGITHDTTEGTA